MVARLKRLYEAELPTYVSVLLGAVFIVASASKALTFAEFKLAIAKLGMVSHAALIASTLIALESTLGFALLHQKTWKLASLVGAITISAFTLVAAYGKAAGKISSCACFGRLFDGEVGIGLYLRNGLLILLCVFLLFRAAGEPSHTSNSKDDAIVDHTVYRVGVFALLLLNVLMAGNLFARILLRKLY